MEPQFFKSNQEFRRWLEKNHNKKAEIWVGFFKRGSSDSKFVYTDAADQALCFGWSWGIIKGIDAFTYKVRFMRRKPGGAWSKLNIKKFNELKKKGLVHKSGLATFESRNKKRSEQAPTQFSSRQLKLFKSNKKAWDFFQTQTKSYQKYTTFWVVNAQKEETQLKRLHMLITDSARESKLQRIVDAHEKIKKRFEPGKTPIEEAKNIGPVSGSELRSLGIQTVEQLKSLGWEEVCRRWCDQYPDRINLNAITSVIAACEDLSWNKLDSGQKLQAKSLVRELKREYKK